MLCLFAGYQAAKVRLPTINIHNHIFRGDKLYYRWHSMIYPVSCWRLGQGSLLYRSEPGAHAAGAQLVQHVALKAADKAEYRTLAAATALRLLEALPEQHQAVFLGFLVSMARCPKVSPNPASAVFWRDEFHLCRHESPAAKVFS